MHWLVADYESFVFGMAVGAVICLLVGCFVFRWIHRELQQVLADYRAMLNECVSREVG